MAFSWRLFPPKNGRWRCQKTQFSSCLRHPHPQEIAEDFGGKSLLYCESENDSIVSKPRHVPSQKRISWESCSTNKWSLKNWKRSNCARRPPKMTKKKANTFRDFFKSEKLLLLLLSPLVLGVFQLDFLRFCSIVWTPKFAKTKKTKEGMLRTLL